MGIYYLSQPASAPRVVNRAMVISAATAADAVEIANLQDDEDFWDVSMAEVVSSSELAPSLDYTGWRFEVRIGMPAVGGVNQPDLVASYTGVATDTLHEVADGLVVALNALTEIANAAYVRNTRTLTVAGVADALGDHYVRVDVFMPGAKSGKCLQSAGAFVESVTDGGAAGDALTVVFPGVPSYENWVLNCRIDTISVSVTGGAAATLKGLMDDMVVALNGTAINGAAYNDHTQVLTVADAADALGDHTVDFDLHHPLLPLDDKIRLIWTSKVDGGAAGDAVTATFKDMALEIPQVLAKYPL